MMAASQTRPFFDNFGRLEYIQDFFCYLVTRPDKPTCHHAAWFSLVYGRIYLADERGGRQPQWHIPQISRGVGEGWRPIGVKEAL